MSKPITIRETNLQQTPVAIPGLTTGVRLNQSSGRTVATYQTLVTERPIQIFNGDVLIVDTGRQEAAGSHLTLPAPPRRYGYEAGVDGATLRIISTCEFAHTVQTSQNAIDGHASLITFAGFGAVELYAQGGKWIVLSSHGAIFE
jgi:hypothetical protein